MKINVNLFPKVGGYSFTERDGTVLRGDNWTGVIARVLDYRRRNGFPKGEPRKEVMAQACLKNPTLCSDETPHQKAARKSVSMKGRMLAWLARLRLLSSRDSMSLVNQPVQQERAKICLSCPMNQELPSGCSSCRAAVAEMRNELISKARVTPGLHGCAALGHDNAVATWIDQPREDLPDAPAHCWRKIGPV